MNAGSCKSLPVKICRGCLATDELIMFQELKENIRYFTHFLKIEIDRLGVHWLCTDCDKTVADGLIFADKVIKANAALSNIVEDYPKTNKSFVESLRRARESLEVQSRHIRCSDRETDNQRSFETSIKLETVQLSNSATDAHAVEYFNECESTSYNDGIEVFLDEVKHIAGIQDKSNYSEHVSPDKDNLNASNAARMGCDPHGFSVYPESRTSPEDDSTKSNRPFKCPLCDFTNAKKVTVAEHYGAFHINSLAPDRETVEVAYQRLNINVEWQKALDAPDESEKDACNKDGNCPHVLDDYSPKDAGSLETYQCRVCGKVFSTQHAQRRHTQRSHRAKCECNHCGRMFVFKQTLQDHIRFKHMGDTTSKHFRCDECGKAFAKNFLLKLHMTGHSNRRDFYCMECNVSFKTSRYLDNHLKRTIRHAHPGSLMQCPHCPIRLPYWKRSSHIERIHRARKFPCNECDVSYSMPGSLRRHVQIVHLQIKKERKYVCETCGKAFTVKKTLDSHMNIHTGVRPHKCIACDATFAYPAALYTHNRLVHLKIKRKQDLKKTKIKVGIRKDPGDVTNADVVATASR